MNAVTMISNTNISISENVRPFVSKFNTLLNKSAEAVLEMGKVVYEARKTLKKEFFDEFCGAIRLNTKSSAISKLKTIGKRYAFLSQFKEDLPDAWTTLYHLARMNEEDFQKGIQHQLIHKTMTANELKAIDPDMFREKSRVNECLITINKDIKIAIGENLSDSIRNELLGKLQTLCSEYGVELVDMGV